MNFNILSSVYHFTTPIILFSYWRQGSLLSGHNTIILFKNQIYEDVLSKIHQISTKFLKFSWMMEATLVCLEVFSPKRSLYTGTDFFSCISSICWGQVIKCSWVSMVSSSLQTGHHFDCFCSENLTFYTEVP